LVILREKNNGQTSLFKLNDISPIVPQTEAGKGAHFILNEKEKLKMEKEMLGFYISNHPLNEYKDKLNKIKYNSETLSQNDENKTVMLGGMLSDCRSIITRTKKEMMMARLIDLRGELSILLFQGKNFETCAPCFQDDNIVFVTGKVRANQNEVSLMCEKIELMDYAARNKSIFIDLENIDNPTIYTEIKALSTQFRGSTPVYFNIGESRVLADRQYWLSEDEICMAQLKSLVGAGHIWVV